MTEAIRRVFPAISYVNNLWLVSVRRNFQSGYETANESETANEKLVTSIYVHVQTVTIFLYQESTW